MSDEPSVEELKYMLDWHAAILAVLLEEAGGAVEISRADLEGIDLSTATANISHDEDRDVFIIERTVVDDES